MSSKVTGIVDLDTYFKLHMYDPNEKKRNPKVMAILGQMEICILDSNQKQIAGSGGSQTVDQGGLSWIHAPERSGTYNVLIKHQGRVVKEGVYQVDDLFCEMEGDGVSRGQVLKESTFRVKFLDKPNGSQIVPAGETFEALVVSPSGKSVDVTIKSQPDGSCNVSYTPTVEGEHSITLKRKGEIVQQASVPVADIDLSVKCHGNGLSAGTVGIESQFSISLINSEEKHVKHDHLNVQIVDEKGESVPCQMSDEGEDTDVRFTPTSTGIHRVNICIGNKVVSSAAVPVFELKLDPGNKSGDGVGWGTVSVRTRVNVGALGPECSTASLPPGMVVLLTGPSGVIECEKSSQMRKRRKSSSSRRSTIRTHGINYTYIPTAVGEHALEIVYRGVKLQSKSVQVNDLVRSVSGVPKKGVQSGVSCSFQITFLDEGTRHSVTPVSPIVRIKGPKDEKVEFSKKFTKEGSRLEISFVPPSAGEYRTVTTSLKKRLKSVYVQAHSYALFFDPLNEGGLCVGIPSEFNVSVIDETGEAIRLSCEDFEIQFEGEDGLSKLSKELHQGGTRLTGVAIPKKSGIFSFKVTHGDLVLEPATFECRDIWYAVEKAYAEEPQAGVDFSLVVEQRHPFSKMMLPLRYWNPFEVGILKPTEKGEMVPMEFKVKEARKKRVVDVGVELKSGLSIRSQKCAIDPSTTANDVCSRIEKQVARVQGNQGDSFDKSRYCLWMVSPSSPNLKLDSETVINQVHLSVDDKEPVLVYADAKEGPVGIYEYPAAKEERTLYVINPERRGNHIADLKVKEESVDQPNLPYTFTVVGKIFDSFIKMYFGDEDAFRKIGVANTYITVGCDRDSDVSTLIENVYTKLGKTVNRDKLEQLRRDTHSYSMVEIPKPADDRVTGEVLATISRTGDEVYVKIQKAKDLALNKSGRKPHPFVAVGFCGIFHKTSTKKETQEADFNEEFTFHLLDGNIPVSASGAQEKIKIAVWDWERGNFHHFHGGIYVDCPAEDSDEKEEWYPVRQYTDEKVLLEFRIPGHSHKGSKVARKGSRLSGSFVKQTKEKAKNERALRRTRNVWNYSLKGLAEMQETDPQQREYMRDRILAFKLHVASYVFDIMYPTQGVVGKEVVVPMLCKDPVKKLKVEDHMGYLIVRLQSPSDEKSIYECDPIPEKIGTFQIKFVPKEKGNWQAWTIFNGAMVHPVPAIIKVKSEKTKK